MKQFFINLISKDSPESSKRFFGGIGFIACVVVICGWKQDLILPLLYTCATMIIGGVLDTLINKIK